MKIIYLIETFPDGLKTVKSHLSDINAKFTEFSSVAAALHQAKIAVEAPSLVVLLADKSLNNFQKDITSLKNSFFYSNIPRVSIIPGEMTGIMSSIPVLNDEHVFHMPVDKLKFLSSLAKLMNLPQRRTFKIIISIQPESGNLKYSGVSIDFSETGMAFESDFGMDLGNKINVSFVNPRNRNRMLLKAEIVRRVPVKSSNRIFYGVRFIGMNKDEMKNLSDFITGEVNPTGKE